jgi:outer membrane immunogenic protein
MLTKIAAGKVSLWLPANWTWKLEYLYLDLGSLDAVTSFAGNIAFQGVMIRGTAPITWTNTTHTHFRDNIVRVGLNYKFDYAAAPAVYK